MSLPEKSGRDNVCRKRPLAPSDEGGATRSESDWGEIVPYFPETVSGSLAPSDEGAVNGVDWGREPGFVFPQRR